MVVLGHRVSATGVAVAIGVRVVDTATSAVVLRSGCYQFTVSQ
jgi:hypothetical protein